MDEVKRKSTGVCPVCNGALRQPYLEVCPTDPERKYAKIMAGYEAATDSMPCRNCGGQTMTMHPIGIVYLRPDGSPCKHEYEGRTTSNCYHEYTCKHCGHLYAIDSGD